MLWAELAAKGSFNAHARCQTRTAQRSRLAHWIARMDGGVPTPRALGHRSPVQWLVPVCRLRRSMLLPQQRGEFVRLFEPAWALLEDGLAVTLRDSLLRGYWTDYMASERKGQPHTKHLQVSRARCSKASLGKVI